MGFIGYFVKLIHIPMYVVLCITVHTKLTCVLVTSNNILVYVLLIYSELLVFSSSGQQWWSIDLCIALLRASVPLLICSFWRLLCYCTSPSHIPIFACCNPTFHAYTTAQRGQGTYGLRFRMRVRPCGWLQPCFCACPSSSADLGPPWALSEFLRPLSSSV